MLLALLDIDYTQALAVWQTFAATVQNGTMEWEDGDVVQTSAMGPLKRV